MIDKRSRSIEWITEAASRIGVHDVALVEKTIRAFSLLEALARAGCPFIFKGGSSLMLHMNTGVSSNAYFRQSGFKKGTTRRDVSKISKSGFHSKFLSIF